MTFYEAGLLILEKAGHPLTYQEIAARAVQEGILSHVGQVPEQTMRERLVALAKRHADRKVVVTGQGQFALTDWGLVEDEAALAELESMKEGEQEGPLIRGRERHPAVTKPQAGREAAGRKKKRRLPPLSSVAQDLLREANQPLSVEDLLARARQKGLVSEDLGREMFVGALQEENRRRAKAGKRPTFEVGAGDLVSYLPPADGGEAGATAAIEGPAHSPRSYSPPLAPQALESRRGAARSIRRLLNDLGAAGLERVVTQLLERSGYRDLRAYSSRAASEGSSRVRMLTARRKLGLTEVRFAVRLVPAGEGEVQREDVQRLRAELTAVSAHAGLVIGPVDVTRDARSESQVLGQPLVTLLCADALAEEIVMRHVGVVTYESTAVDESYWRDLRKLSREAASADRTRARAASAGGPAPASGLAPSPPDQAEAAREGAVAATAGGDAEVTDFEVEGEPPDIDQFLNETIPPKPPDALPLEKADSSEETDDATKASGDT
jgi:hypothetical protein